MKHNLRCIGRIVRVKNGRLVTRRWVWAEPETPNVVKVMEDSVTKYHKRFDRELERLKMKRFLKLRKQEEQYKLRAMLEPAAVEFKSSVSQHNLQQQFFNECFKNAVTLR